VSSLTGTATPGREIAFPSRNGDATRHLQAAIDEAAATRTRLTLLPGLHRCRGILLRSGLDLHLAEGAVLQAEADYEAYAATTVDSIAEDSDRAVFMAKDAADIRIGGPGVIDAGGEAFIDGELPEMGTHLPARHRPRVFVLDGCRNLTLEDFTVRASPMWTIHLIACRDVTIAGISVDNDRRMPNTDGIVIDSCEGVEIRNVAIATADDGIVLKTTRRADGRPIGPCRDIAIRDSRIESFSCALKIGTETWSDVENVEIADCRVLASNRALGIFSRDGGSIRRIAFRRIGVDCRETPDGFWGSGEAITVTLVDRRAERPAGAVEDLLFEDISGRMAGAVNLIADGRAGIANVTLRRLALTQTPGALGTGLRYDLRPTRFDLAPAPQAAGRANAFVKDEAGAVIGLVAYPDGMPGLFASNVAGLVQEEVRLERPVPLPAGWNEEPCLILENEPQRW